MKPIKTILAIFLLLACSVNSKAQTPADYFAGSWSVLLKGLPQGDTKLVFILEKKDTSMTGVVKDTSDNEVAKLDKVELAEGTATLYFVAQGYNVTLVMNKKDEDHVTGSLMNMFDAEGERIKK